MGRDGWLFIVLTLGFLGVLVYLRLKENKKLKLRTLEAISPALREEIEIERQQNIEKRRKFENALQKAQDGESPSLGPKT